MSGRGYGALFGAVQVEERVRDSSARLGRWMMGRITVLVGLRGVGGMGGWMGVGYVSICPHCNAMVVGWSRCGGSSWIGGLRRVVGGGSGRGGNEILSHGEKDIPSYLS